MMENTELHSKTNRYVIRLGKFEDGIFTKLPLIVREDYDVVSAWTNACRENNLPMKYISRTKTSSGCISIRKMD